MSDEWRAAGAQGGSGSHKAGLVRDEDGGARLVPGDNIVEGEIEEDGRKAPSACPFSSP